MNINKTKSNQLKSLCLIASLFASGIFVNNADAQVADAQVKVFENITALSLVHTPKGQSVYHFRFTHINEKRTVFYVDDITIGNNSPCNFYFIVEYDKDNNSYSIYVPNYNRYNKQMSDTIRALKAVIIKNKESMRKFFSDNTVVNNHTINL